MAHRGFDRECMLQQRFGFRVFLEQGESFVTRHAPLIAQRNWPRKSPKGTTDVVFFKAVELGNYYRQEACLSTFVKVDLNVLRRAARGDHIEFAITIEVCQAKVFARHHVIVEKSLRP